MYIYIYIFFFFPLSWSKEPKDIPSYSKFPGGDKTLVLKPRAGPQVRWTMVGSSKQLKKLATHPSSTPTLILQPKKSQQVQKEA